MKSRLLYWWCFFVLLAGCAEELRGPDASLSQNFVPNVACNADPAVSDPTNGIIETRIVLRSASDAGTFSPLPINRIAGDAGIELPHVVLTGPDGASTDLELRQVEYVSPAEMALWVTRISRTGMPLTPGTYAVTVRNPNGSRATVQAALRITAPPVLDTVRRLEPAVPSMPADPNEFRTVCNGQRTVLSLQGRNFRPSDPKPIVELLDPMNNPRRLPDEAITVASDTEIRVTLIPSMDVMMRLTPGNYGFRITNPDGSSTIGTGMQLDYPQGCHATKMDLITVVPPPEIRSIEPVAACTSRGQQFTVRGQFFRRGLEVSVASMPEFRLPNGMVMLSSSTMSMTSFDTATFTVPMGSIPAGGPYSVSVHNADGCSATLAPSCPAGTMPTANANECSGMVGMNPSGTGPRSLTIYPDPTITAVMPMMVCSGGGQMLAITGTGFHATYGVAPTVTITAGMSTVTLTDVVVNSETMLTARVPGAGLPPGGPYTVSLTLPEGCGATRTMALTVVPGPVVAAILPARGWNMIDMPVSILGDGFMGVSSIFLRGAGPMGADYQLTDLQVVDGTLINATIPAGAVAGGPYDVVVRSMGGCDAVLARGYTVQSMPSLTISRVIPPFGWTGSTTPVTITGMNFASTPRAFLVIPSRRPRLVPLRRTIFTSQTTLTALVPDGLPVGGPYDLVVINPDGGGGLLSMAFRVTMQPPPTIETILPSQGTTSAPTVVTITGANFRGTPQVTLTPATGTGTPINATGVMVDAASMGTRLTATAPTNTMTPGAYIVRVTNTDENTYAEFGTFVVTNPAEKLGTFTRASNLVEARRGLGAASGRINGANRFVYALGGDSGGGTPMVLNSIEFAQVDIFGVLGPWRVQRNRLNTARTRLGVVRQGNFLYALGGSSDARTSTPLASVERAKILDFSDAPVISDPMVRRVAMGPGLAAGSWLYVVSAIKDPMMDPDNPGETLPSDEVVATLVSNSTVTLTWRAVTGARAYRVYRTPMVNGASGGEVLLADNVMGTTFTDDGMMMPMAASPNTTPMRPGSTGLWIAATNLPRARDGAGVQIAPDPSGALFLYALGGNGSCMGMGAPAPTNCYDFAPLSADGRTLGAWTMGSNSLGTARWMPGSANAIPEAVPGLPAGTSIVYVTGGFDTNTSSTRQTEQARVNMGGSLGTFAPTMRQYGGSRGSPTAYVTNGTFYVLGGTGGMTPFSAGLDSSVLAQLDNAGSFAGPFSNASGRMTVARTMHGLANESAYFFVLGGTTDGTTAINTVDQVIH